MRPRGLEDRAARPGRPKAGDPALSVAPGVKPLAAAPEALTGIVVGPVLKPSSVIGMSSTELDIAFLL